MINTNEKLLVPTIKCASDRGGCVLLGNRYFQYMADITSLGDGTMSVKIISYDEWCRLREIDKRYNWEHTRRLGTLEGHFYLYDFDCAHGNKEDTIVEFNGAFYLYDWCDNYDPTLYIVVGIDTQKKKRAVKVLRESRYQEG